MDGKAVARAGPDVPSFCVVRTAQNDCAGKTGGWSIRYVAAAFYLELKVIFQVFLALDARIF